jgi:hypothetical protein
MKRKNILLATTAIAASLAAGSVSAGPGGSDLLSWASGWDPDVQVDILKAIPDEGCMLLFEGKKDINEVAKELGFSKGDYREKRYANGWYRMAINEADAVTSLAAYLKDNVNDMSDNQVGSLYDALGTAGVDLVCDNKKAARSFIQTAGISSLAEVVGADGSYGIEAKA